MKTTVKVKTNKESEAKALTEAFFRVYSSKNRLEIKDGEVELEIDLNDCDEAKAEGFIKDVLEVVYQKEKNISQETEANDTQINNRVEEKIEEIQNPQDFKPSKDVVQQRKGMGREKRPKAVGDEEKLKKVKVLLIQFAEQATSLEEFWTEVSKKLSFKERREEVFCNAMLAATVLDTTIWQKIIKFSEKNGKVVTQNDTTYISGTVKRRFMIGGGQFVELMLECQKQCHLEHECTKTNLEQQDKEKNNEGLFAISRFVKKLDEIDKSKPVCERVEMLISILEIDVDPTKKKNIQTIVEFVLKMKEPNLQDVQKKCMIPEDQFVEARLMLAQRINEIAKNFAIRDYIKVEAFLVEVQPYILSQAEIQKL